MTPHISIIMPCYNAAAYLPQSVGSVLAQTRSNWELVIVDDGSTDASWQELQRLAAADPRIRVFRQPNAGAAAARNRALLDAHGVYTAFLDADDTWHPEFLEAMEAALDNDPGAGIAYCGWQNMGLGGGRDDPFVPPEYEHSGKTESLLEACRWPIHAALVRTRLIHDCGRFDERLSSCMDYDLWLRLGTIHRLIRVPRVLAYYHHHGGEQITSNLARIALNHWRVQQKFLSKNPAIRDKLGNDRLREITDGELLKRGYASYWNRDLGAARQIFRAVMARGYGKAKDWEYMLPALLPLFLHQALIRLKDRGQDEKALPEVGFMDEMGDGMTPSVSIIIPCYNGASFLREAIDSALGQTYPNKEVIVVNDGSTDESLTIMRSYGPRIMIIDQQNAGLPSARNAGINKSSGDYFAFLDADDYWATEFLSHMLTALEGRGAAIAYCGWQNTGLPGSSGQPYIPPDYEAMPDKLEKLVTGVRWPVHAALIRREILYEAGLFNPALKSCEDFALWIRAATRHPLVLVPEVLAFYRFHDNQMTSNRKRIALSHYEVQRTYLRESPDIARLLGKEKVSTIVLGELLKRGYISYWKRDLSAARSIFRKVMCSGYGSIKDWQYMLPSLLPLPLHRWLIQLLENKSQVSSPDKFTKP